MGQVVSLLNVGLLLARANKRCAFGCRNLEFSYLGYPTETFLPAICSSTNYIFIWGKGQQGQQGPPRANKANKGQHSQLAEP